MIRTGTGESGLSRTVFRLSVIFCVALGLIFGSAALSGMQAKAYAGSGACERNTHCGIGGKSFDVIYYSSGVSGLVVLYDRNKVGTLQPWVSEKKYRRGTGTVEDAVAFLSSDPEYVGYRVVKGKKSKGFFRSEAVSGLYVVEPVHRVMSNLSPPEYRFVEKDGKIVLYITDVNVNNDDENGS